MMFETEHGLPVPAITAEQMREVDRIAVDDFKLGIVQMMENAGRTLAQHVLAMLGTARGIVTILAGAGGNGGGGLCCARHLHNHGVQVQIILDVPPDHLKEAARRQFEILQAAGIEFINSANVERVLSQAALVVDALIGYGLHDAPRPQTARLIGLCNRQARLVLSNDLPSGMNATTGDSPGVVIRADRILTLAAPKTGLRQVMGTALYLADIGIPPEVFGHLGISFPPVFSSDYWVQIKHTLP
jgi:NAD(P)H-hydrate epimerase